MLSNGICSSSSSIKNQIIEKHPKESEYKITYSDPLPQQIHADFEDVRKSITRIRRTKAPGPDGWRPFFWKPIIGYCFEERIIKKLTILINKVFRGAFNTVLGSNFSVSRGIPIAKDPQKKNVRPIAIGLSFRRLCTSIVNKKINSKLTNKISSMNLGNSRNGIPIFVHMVRNLLNYNSLNKQKDIAVIEFDIKNAFNDIKRSFMREVCQIYFPSIIKYFDLTYAKHSNIIYSNDFLVSSQRGFQQGDGLSVMFALCLFHLFHKDDIYKKTYFFKFFHDDGRCIAPIKDVKIILDYVLSKLDTVGLKLNLKKTKVYVLPDRVCKIKSLKNELGIKVITDFNFEMLGSFVGSDHKTKLWLKDLFKKYKKFLRLLKNFDHKQSKWRVLSYFTGYSNFQNVIRTIPGKYLQDFILEIDKEVSNMISEIIESPLNLSQQIQSSLPISFGGLGVLCLKTYTMAIKSALWTQICDFLYCNLVTEKKYFDKRAFDLINTEYSITKKFLVDFVGYKSVDDISKLDWSNQRYLVQKIAEKQWSKICNNNTPNYHRARLFGCRAKAASGWVFSSAAPYTRLSNNEFRVISCFWLGIPLVQENTKCRFCDRILDKYGAHTITCNKGGSHIKRHNYIRNFLFRKCKEAGYVAELEKKHICTHDGKKPADLWLQNLVNNKPTAVDVSITSPTQLSIVHDRLKGIFKAAKIVEAQKKYKYAPTIAKGDIEFIPFVLEAYGGISTEAMKLIRRLASDLRDRTRRPKSIIMANIMKCLTVRVWKANVESFNLRTFSPSPIV